jgi:hypothetical protein
MMCAAMVPSLTTAMYKLLCFLKCYTTTISRQCLKRRTWGILPRRFESCDVRARTAVTRPAPHIWLKIRSKADPTNAADIDIHDL